ncbi:MAG TPA: bestrophin family protein [Chryseolinea sp.]|nr:bestrophin family protein [Chryseolinea sp.]
MTVAEVGGRVANIFLNGVIAPYFPMVSYNPRQWFSLIFHSYSKRVMMKLMPALVFMTVYSTILVYFSIDFFKIHQADFQPTIAMHQLLGIVLGLFLVFRTNTAYDRWWEGRRLWGGLVNSTRNFAMKLHACISKENHENREWFARMIPNFIFAMKENLRTGVQFSELDATDETFINDLKKYKHKPNRIASHLYRRVNDLYVAGKITGDQLINLDKELKDFIDMMGACERIKNTPIPYSYMMYVKKFIFIYIITLPFGFVVQSGYMTVPIVVLVSYVLLSVELIAEEIEDPFGRDVNDLPLDELALKIKENVKEILL